MQRAESNKYFILIIFIASIFLSLSWFVSDPIRAAKMDRFFLYSVDDVFRYCHIKASVFNGLVFFSPYVKIGYAIVSRIFYEILPLGMTSLRIINALFSVGILILVRKLTQKLYAYELSSYATTLLIVTFPIFFLLSISTLSEVLFCFFLIWAAYLFYTGRYNMSLLLASLLPLFRQEGIIFLFIWGYYLRSLSQARKIILLFVPFTLWMLFILYQNIFNHALLWLIPNKPPINSVASLLQGITLVSIFIFSPLIILCIVGLIINFYNKKFKFLKICFISYILFLLIFQFVHFLKFKSFCRELRIVMPAIPIMAIFAGSVFDRFLRRISSYRRVSIIVFTIILIIIMSFQIVQLQKDSFVVNDSVTAEQEKIIKDVSIWLNNYMSKENIEKVYVPGILTMHKIIRRLWMYMPGYVGFYAASGSTIREAMIINESVLDMVVLKPLTILNNMKGIFISTYPNDKEKISNKINYRLLKSIPDISLYIYLIEG
ncbi:MAG: hypothetical protein ISS47_01650 [Candidatus Omnitrophica bacterium]|nr:hypothetical protein [Candidatus Omnitrophota bacterium]